MVVHIPVGFGFWNLCYQVWSCESSNWVLNLHWVWICTGFWKCTNQVWNPCCCWEQMDQGRDPESHESQGRGQIWTHLPGMTFTSDLWFVALDHELPFLPVAWPAKPPDCRFSLRFDWCCWSVPRACKSCLPLPDSCHCLLTGTTALYLAISWS